MIPNCLPTPTQQLLLQAALLPQPQAAFCWKAYCSQVDLQKAPPLDTTLFPLVYSNFKQSDSPELKTCKSIYRHTWSHNNFQFFSLKKALQLLNGASIQTTLLKGASMILQYYQDPGLRVIGDIDLLIPRSSAKQTIQILLDAGWQSTENVEVNKLDQWIQRTHSIHLKNNEDHVIDLHWSVLSESGIDSLFANYTYRTSELTSYNTTTLSPEDQLLHTLFHGMKYSPQPLIRWIPDAVTLLTKTPDFEWEYFLSQIHHLKIELPIFTALSHLQGRGFIKLPANISLIADHYIPTQRELSHFRFLTTKPAKLSLVQTYWHSHVRNSNSQNLIALLFRLPGFVKNAQKLTHWHQLIPFASRKLFKILIGK